MRSEYALALYAVLILVISLMFKLQLGFVTLLLVVLFGGAAAIYETRRPMFSGVLGLMCGILALITAHDIGMRPETLVRAWGREASMVAIWFMWGASLFIIGRALHYLASLLWPEKPR